MASYVNTESDQLIVEVQVRDMNRAIAFYRELGFELTSEGDEFTVLSWDGRDIFLDLRDDLPPPSAIPQANLRIMVPDVDRRWERVTAMGARIIDPIADRDYGLRDFIFTDPDGFGLRFASLIE